MKGATATLWIDRSSSQCGACGRGADPQEKAHDTILDWSDSGTPGCGATYVAVSSHYAGASITDGVRAMRPDLPFVPYPAVGDVDA